MVSSGVIAVAGVEAARTTAINSPPVTLAVGVAAGARDGRPPTPAACKRVTRVSKTGQNTHSTADPTPHQIDPPSITSVSDSIGRLLLLLLLLLLVICIILFFGR